MSDYKDLSEVLDVVEDTMVISLVDHACMLDDVLEQTLLPATPGLYLPGSYEPFFKHGTKYFVKGTDIELPLPKPTAVMEGIVTDAGGKKSEFRTSRFRGQVVVSQPQLLVIDNIDDILKIAADIYREDGTLVCSKEQLNRYRRHFSRLPSIPAQSVKMAIAVAMSRLQSFCPHAILPTINFNQTDLVTPKYAHLVYNDEYSQGFAELLDKIRDITRKSEWNLYFVRITGTNLIIRKGIDWRIYDWYRMKFEKEEKEKEGLC